MSTYNHHLASESIPLSDLEKTQRTIKVSGSDLRSPGAPRPREARRGRQSFRKPARREPVAEGLGSPGIARSEVTEQNLHRGRRPAQRAVPRTWHPQDSLRWAWQRGLARDLSDAPLRKWPGINWTSVGQDRGGTFGKTWAGEPLDSRLREVQMRVSDGSGCLL